MVLITLPRRRRRKKRKRKICKIVVYLSCSAGARTSLRLIRFSLLGLRNTPPSTQPSIDSSGIFLAQVSGGQVCTIFTLKSDFKGHIKVCASWHIFMVKYNLAYHVLNSLPHVAIVWRGPTQFRRQNKCHWHSW